jgi:hypothetical protein
MYLKGTYQQCIEYDHEITLGEKYKSPTVRWENVSHHKNGIDFAILKHQNYESELEQIENLEGWFDNTEL